MKTLKELLAAGANGVSRRSSVGALAGALAAAAVAPPMVGQSAPRAGKVRKKARKVCDARLQAQAEALRATCDTEITVALEKQLSRARLDDTRACVEAVRDICDNEPNPEVCVGNISPCCDEFLTGNSGEAARCLLLALVP